MPELPDTSDPTTLLGVAADASADEVRRAYLGKIKIFKPDRDPAAFQRLREAYERLAARIESEAGPTPGRAAAPTTGWDLDAEPAPSPRAAEPVEVVPSSPGGTERRHALAALTRDIAAALAGGRREDAVSRLLAAETQLLATDPDFTRPLLDAVCATQWTAPELSARLIVGYPDVFAAADRPGQAHAEHPVWDLRALSYERLDWHQRTTAWPALNAFLELGAVVQGEARRTIGTTLADAIVADPMGLLALLDDALKVAPGVVELLAERADAWADEDLAAARDTSSPTAVALVRQLEAGLTDPARLGGEWFKRIAVTLGGPAIVVAVGAPLGPLLFSLLVGMLAYHVTFDATRSLYFGVVRPVVAPWLVATGQPLSLVTEQWRRQVAARGSLWHLARPDEPRRYAALLDKDRALDAFASLARLAHTGRTR